MRTIRLPDYPAASAQTLQTTKTSLSPPEPIGPPSTSVHKYIIRAIPQILSKILQLLRLQRLARARRVLAILQSERTAQHKRPHGGYNHAYDFHPCRS
jgi:hypothetical protein